MADSAKPYQLPLTQATVLSFSYSTERFDGNLRFGIRKRVTIRTTNLNCGNKGTEGQIGDQVKTLDDLIATKDYIELSVNGKTFTDERFQLTSFNIEEGNWTSATSASLTLESWQDGQLETQVGTPNTQPDENYAGWNLTEPEWKWLESFSDNFSFNRAGNSISYEHSVNFKFAAIAEIPNAEISPPITLGLKYATEMLESSSRPAFDWLLDAATTQDLPPSTESHGLQSLYSDIGPSDSTTYKRFLTENVDEINSSVTVTESFSAKNVVPESGGDNYSFSATQSFELTENGVINVSEQGEIIGLVAAEDGILRTSAFPLVSVEKGKATAALPDGRLQNIFKKHTDQLTAADQDELLQCTGTIPPLVTKSDGSLVLIEDGVTVDDFRGTASYSIKATNDQKIGELASHVFTRTVAAITPENWLAADINNDAYYKISQNGTFIGVESKNLVLEGNKKERPRYDAALKAWTDNVSLIKAYLRNQLSLAADKYPASLSNTYNKFEGQVGYTIEYSTEPKYGTTAAADYKSKTFNYTDTYTIGDDAVEGVADCLRQYSLQNVVNHEQVLQERLTTQPPAANASYHLVGHRSTTLQQALAHFEDANSPLPQQAAVNGPKTLDTCNYTFNANNDKVLDINFTWK